MNVSKNNFRDDFEKIVSLLILMINSKDNTNEFDENSNESNQSDQQFHLETHKDVKDVTKLLIKTENLIIKILIQMLNGS